MNVTWSQSSYSSEDQLYKQLFVSIKCMAQLCHCHHQKTQTITCCWEKTGQDVKSQTKATKKQEDSCQCSQSSVFYINMSWEAAVQERSSWSRCRTLKLDWSLLLITWTKKKTFWRKTLWSEETNTELFDHNEQQYVWRRDGEAFNPKLLSGTVLVVSCCGAVVLSVDLLI